MRKFRGEQKELGEMGTSPQPQANKENEVSKENGNEKAENTVRVRLMEISQAVPPPVEDVSDTSPKPSSSPPDKAGEDEVRRNLISLSY